MDLFGFTITRNTPKDENISFVPPNIGDAVTIENNYANNRVLNSVVDIETVFKSEEELINRYRELALFSEVDAAIQDIINEAITEDIEGNIVNLDLSKVDNALLPEALHEDVHKAFNKILSTMNFKLNAIEYFRRWYTEGRLYFHAIIDPADVSRGVVEYRFIDPLTLKKVNKVDKEKHPETGVELYYGTKEYFLYVANGFNNNSATEGIEISSDNIIYSTSGIVDGSNNITLSYLHKALRPANQLRMIEDANIIYFLSRAPERRVFNIEVGSLQKDKAEQYIQQIMNNHRNKTSYDSVTGTEKESKRFLSILEDYWMPMRDGKGTTITPLAGGTQLTQQLESINYFRQKLYKSLNIPISRIDSGNQFNVGRATEITRDEIKLQKFINVLRVKFSRIFISALRLECILTGILTLEDWEEIEEYVTIDFAKDNHFFELKDLEILDTKLDVLSKAKDIQGKFYSQKTIAIKVLGMSEEEYEEEQKQIALEKLKNPDQDREDENDFNSGFGGSSFGGNSFSSTPSDSEEETSLNNIDTSNITGNEINSNELGNEENPETIENKPEGV